MAVNLSRFVQASTNLAPTDHVKLKERDDGSIDVVRGRNGLGTRAAQWFRNTLHIADPATKAFKAAVGQAVGGDRQAARTLLHNAGIHERKPLTQARIQAVNNALVAQQAPPPTQPPPVLVQPPPIVITPTVTTPPPRVLVHGGPQQEQAARQTLPGDMVQAWDKFVALANNGQHNSPMGVANLAMFEFALKGGLDQAGRAALLDLIAGHSDQVAEALFAAEAVTGRTLITDFAETLHAMRDVVADKADDPDLLQFIDDWRAEQPVRPPVPLGRRLETERADLESLGKVLASPAADRATAMQTLRDMGGRLVAAVLEEPLPGGHAFGSAGRSPTGAVAFHKDTHGDVAALLATSGQVQARTDLLPLDDPQFAPVFKDATLQFLGDYGVAAGAAALVALRRAGVAEKLLAPLHDAVAAMVRDRSCVDQLAVHGGGTPPRVIDGTAAFARAIAFQHPGGPKFDNVVTGSGKLDPPPLRPEVDLDKVPTAKGLDDLLGSGFKLKAEDGSQIQANGRTLRFEGADGRVIALKLMRADESPGKLQREHNAFGLMQAALGDDYPAHPRKFDNDDGGSAMIWLPKSLLSDDARTKLQQELANGGLTLHEDDGHYLVTSYEARPGRTDANQFFAYLEETHDDAAFVGGFESSMATLGKMAAKGYFDPSLILNSYHDSSGGRSWVWSPNMLVPELDHAGGEERPLMNAQWSNFRVGGLADPDEFRHISDLRSSELGALIGDTTMASSLKSSDPQSGEALVPTYLFGRMLHESLVIATRRAVKEGAFDSTTTPERRAELLKTMQTAVERGVMAFATGATGAEPDEIRQQLVRNGLDLDKTIKGMIDERVALHSFAYLDHVRAEDSAYFAKLYGIDGGVVQFGGGELDRDELMPPIAEILKSDDPMAILQKQQKGFVSVVATDSGGRPVAMGDLGWISNPERFKHLLQQEGDPVSGVRIEKTASGAFLIMVDGLPDGGMDAYLTKLRDRTRDYQNTGPANGYNFFQNEMHLNYVLSATLVNMRSV